MSTLYISPGTCSLAAHVVVQELKLDINVIKVPIRTQNSPINRISPFRKVPALVLDNGTLITENTSLLPYLADLDKSQRLTAKVGTESRIKIQSWLGFFSSELHAGGFRIFFRKSEFINDEKAQESIAEYGLNKIKSNFKIIDDALDNKDFLIDDHLSIVDIYLGAFLHWYNRIDSQFTGFPNLKRSYQRFLTLPSFKQAIATEALSLGASA